MVRPEAADAARTTQRAAERAGELLDEGPVLIARRETPVCAGMAEAAGDTDGGYAWRATWGVRVKG